MLISQIIFNTVCVCLSLRANIGLVIIKTKHLRDIYYKSCNFIPLSYLFYGWLLQFEEKASHQAQHLLDWAHAYPLSLSWITFTGWRGGIAQGSTFTGSSTWAAARARRWDKEMQRPHIGDKVSRHSRCTDSWKKTHWVSRLKIKSKGEKGQFETKPYQLQYCICTYCSVQEKMCINKYLNSIIRNV